MSSPNYSYSNEVYDLFKDQELCDITLVAGIDGIRIPVHRIVMCATSHVIHALVKSQLDNQSGEINIDKIEGEILKLTVECCYTGTCDIDDENIFALFTAASNLICPPLMKQCTKYLMGFGKINVRNCIGIQKIASQSDFLNLDVIASRFVSEHFMEVAKQDEFLKLSEPELVKLLESNSIAVDSEEDVFNALVDWIEFDIDQRKALFPGLLRVIRIGNLKDSFMLQHVFSVCLQMDCLDKFATLTELNKAKNSNQIKGNGLRPLPFPDLVGVGLSNGGTDGIFVQRYSERFQKWNMLVILAGKRTGYGSVLVGSKLYIFGGLVDATMVTTAFSFDLKTKKRLELRSMIGPRYGHSSIVLGDFIYTIGGSCLVSEKYDIKSDEWTLLTSMVMPRTYAAVATLSGVIFIMGGFITNTILDSVERYDPVGNVWRTMAPMLRKRQNPCAGVAHGKIYIVGGFDGNEYLSCIECYDPIANNWMMIYLQLSKPIRNFAMTLYQDWIIAVGSEDRSCERINLRTSEREFIEKSLIESNLYVFQTRDLF